MACPRQQFICTWLQTKLKVFIVKSVFHLEKNNNNITFTPKGPRNQFNWGIEKKINLIYQKTTEFKPLLINVHGLEIFNNECTNDDLNKQG